MYNPKLDDANTTSSERNAPATRAAHKNQVKSASWLKIIVFAVPVIAVIVGVIWASSLE